MTLHVQQTPLGVIEWDTNFRIVDWNNSAEKIFGYTKSEALGRTALDLIVHEKVTPLANEIWSNLINNTGGHRSTNEKPPA